MFHMLICFDLKSGVLLDQFCVAVSAFTDHLRGLDLAVGVSPVGRRESDTPLDTDRERAHEYFAIMSFRDRKQSDAAHAYLKSRAEPGLSIHHAVNSKASNPIFICWADI
jgi:hypothetical protein